MADKSKMTVAEILAAARKADRKGGASSAPSDEADAAPPQSEAAAEESPADAPTESKPAAPPAKKAAGGARPSVADMLAMARGETKTPAAAPKEKPAAKPAPKPAAAAAKKEAAPAKGPVDTQSILAAARAGTKPGPMTKSEAAAKAPRPAPAVQKAKAKEAIVVPPMPARPDYAKPAPARSKDKDAERAERRAFLFGMSSLAIGFTALAATAGAWTLMTARFMFPNIVRLPPSRFKVGGPDKFPPGQVEEKFKAQFGVWVVNSEYNGVQQIFALKSVCTHLGCTPNWLEAEQKFKCPCHGSGFYKDGINFEGPAPRPLERYAISIAADGEIEVDKSRIFQEEMGQWNDASSFIPT